MARCAPFGVGDTVSGCFRGIKRAVQDIYGAVEINCGRIENVAALAPFSTCGEDGVLCRATEGARWLFGVECTHQVVELHTRFRTDGISRAIPDIELTIVADCDACREDNIWHETILLIKLLWHQDRLGARDKFLWVIKIKNRSLN